MTESGGEVGLNFSLTELGQPPLTQERVASAAGSLKAYRVMAFVTGVMLLAACVALVLKYATSMNVKALNGVLWVGHGWLYFVYLIVAVVLGFKLRWPLPRYVLVLLAGTIPTMSFVAEHFVTKAVREATGRAVETV